MTGHFSRYVGGLPGAGLLILRAAVGVTALSQGCALVPSHESEPSWQWSFPIVMCLGGAALILGALTVFTSLAIALAEIVAACSLLPSLRPALSHAEPMPLLILVMTIAVILIGPGAFSIDARLFGLREVKIPRTAPPADL